MGDENEARTTNMTGATNVGECGKPYDLKMHSRIKVHFVVTFLDILSIVSVSAFSNVD